MLARYMLDTNICIYALSERSPSISNRVRDLAVGEAVVSVIVQGELVHGAQKSDRKDAALLRLNALLHIVPAVALTADAADAYGEIRAELEKLGTPIGNNGLWIAAHARAAGLILVTNNEREFKRVRGLKVQNWVKA